MVVVGEGLADQHLRLLAKAIPEGSEELLRHLGVSPSRFSRTKRNTSTRLGLAEPPTSPPWSRRAVATDLQTIGYNRRTARRLIVSAATLGASTALAHGG